MASCATVCLPTCGTRLSGHSRSRSVWKLVSYITLLHFILKVFLVFLTSFHLLTQLSIKSGNLLSSLGVAARSQVQIKLRKRNRWKPTWWKFASRKLT